MKRCLPILLVALTLAWATMLIAGAQVEVPGYVVSDLQLISQESKAEWSEIWTGPIQAATILAWFAEHGYPALIRDFNGDGVIDERDTVELADQLGRGAMASSSARGTTDVRLVRGLAEYVAERYPDRFELKVYDPGFPAEWAREQGTAFDPQAIGGIELVVKPEPTIAAYKMELEGGEGVIVGLSRDPLANNLYLSGRSFLYETASQGLVPVDLAWAKEDYWLPGHQGEVLETLARMDDRLMIDFEGQWTWVEFMLALSPTTKPSGTSQPGSCPEDAVAYDVTVTPVGSYGSIEIAECVTREGSVDTYEYTVSNIDFLYNGCGLCLFGVPKPLALGTISHTEAAPWLYSLYPSGWVWRLPVGSCGILPGESAVFSVSVPGPTTDTAVQGIGATCVTVNADGSYNLARIVPLRTTGPGESDGRCPDLTVRVLDQACSCDPATGMCTLTVWADVLNIGTQGVASPFDVVLSSPEHPGFDLETYTPPPVLPPGGIWNVQLSFSFPTEGELCPTTYRVTVDPSPAPNGVIAECKEDNNRYEGSVDCLCDQGRGACCLPDGTCVALTEDECKAREGTEFHPGVPCTMVQCPPPEEPCPDLVVTITSVSCRNVGATAPLYEVSIEAEVTNIGSAKVTQSIWVKAESVCGSDTDIIHTDLDPGDTATAEFEMTCTANQPGCHDLTVTVDYPRFIDECDEKNNEAEGTFCCR